MQTMPEMKDTICSLFSGTAPTVLLRMETAAAPKKEQAPLWLRLIFGKNPSRTFVRILVVISVTLILFRFVLQPIRVSGDSMFPTYSSGQIRFLNRLAYSKTPPRRGDVVAVEFAGSEILLLGRIIVLPGETFEVREGEVLINGSRIEEPYTRGKIPSPAAGRPGYTTPIPVGQDQYVVIGDDRNIAEGYIKRRSEIVGKVL
jgi:signal peptidase I